MAYTMIETKYLGYTNHRPSRIVASRGKRRHYVPYDHSMTPQDNHAAAAKVLADEITTKGQWIAANHHDGDRMVFVLLSNWLPIDGFTTE